MHKYLIPYDVFERHKFIAKFITADDKVLDVGGGIDTLSRFVPNSNVKVINVAGSEELKNNKDNNLYYDGKHLPFKSDSFDVLTAVDVLEHIPASQRGPFIKELLRVSKKKIIISAPLGTDNHIKYEKKLLVELKNESKKVKYLSEHIKEGLPTLGEIKSLAMGYKYKLFFSGDLRVVEFLFMLHEKELANNKLNRFFYYLKVIINTVFNIVGFKFLTNLKYSENINRFYLYIEK